MVKSLMPLQFPYFFFHASLHIDMASPCKMNVAQPTGSGSPFPSTFWKHKEAVVRCRLGSIKRNDRANADSTILRTIDSKEQMR